MEGVVHTGQPLGQGLRRREKAEAAAGKGTRGWLRNGLGRRCLTAPTRARSLTIPRLGAGLTGLEEGEPGACRGARGEPSGSSAPSAERRPPLHAKPLPPLPAPARPPGSRANQGNPARRPLSVSLLLVPPSGWGWW